MTRRTTCCLMKGKSLCIVTHSAEKKVKQELNSRGGKIDVGEESLI